MFTIRSKKFQQHLVAKPRGVCLNFPRLPTKNAGWESRKASKLVRAKKK